MGKITGMQLNVDLTSGDMGKTIAELLAENGVDLSTNAVSVNGQHLTGKAASEVKVSEGDHIRATPAARGGRR